MTTAPSTQPPDTEPRKLPSLSITRLEPTGRGAEPQVSITVAMRDAAASLAPVFRGFEDVFVARESCLLHHATFLSQSFGSNSFCASPDSAATSPAIELQIVDRPQLIDMRQHRLDALGARLEALEAQQRIEPDQPPAGAMQPVHLEGERVVGVALEPVGDQQHDRALGEDAPRPNAC